MEPQAGLAHCRSLSQRARSMGDARAAASSSDDAAAMVAPLLELWERAMEMMRLQRWARVVELLERALEQARRTLPPNNLVVAWMIESVATQRVLGGNMMAVVSGAAHRDLEKLLVDAFTPPVQAMSRERLMACCTRFEAGTLGTLTAEERAFFSALDLSHLERLGEELLLVATRDAIETWAVDNFEEVAALLAGGVQASVRTVLALDPRGELEPWLRKRAVVHRSLTCVVDFALGEVLAGPGGQPRTFRFPYEIETALRRLQALLLTMPEIAGSEPMRVDPAVVAESHARAAADVARHGLSTCALPTCDAKEPHPRFFKCCSRCRSVFYCSPEHQREDWPRHRAADRCTKPAAN